LYVNVLTPRPCPVHVNAEETGGGKKTVKPALHSISGFRLRSQKVRSGSSENL